MPNNEVESGSTPIGSMYDAGRWEGIWRPSQEEVSKLAGPYELKEHYTLSLRTSMKLWRLMKEANYPTGWPRYVHALGAVTGNQAMQMVKAGLQAVYVSGWQAAADANDSLNMYPDQSLYSVNSVPMLVRRINNTFKRAAQIEWMDYNGMDDLDDRWLCPIVADAEAGFGGPLNVFELTKAMIEAGTAALHLEDQLSSVKKCGHMGSKVLVPASEFIKKLKAARLAAEVYDVPLVIIARTDANSARLLISDVDDEDEKFVNHPHPSVVDVGEYRHARTSEGFYHITGGLEMAINRGLQYAPYADMLWMETSKPDLDEAKAFAEAIHEKFPGKLLAYNCSPSFNWSKHLSVDEIRDFQKELGKMGYKFQFVTLAGFHSINHAMFRLARRYHNTDMTGYSYLQNLEHQDAESLGYTAVKHQAEVGTSYFDLVAETIDGETSTLAMKGSTEEEQFD